MQMLSDFEYVCCWECCLKFKLSEGSELFGYSDLSRNQSAGQEGQAQRCDARSQAAAPEASHKVHSRLTNAHILDVAGSALQHAAGTRAQLDWHYDQPPLMQSNC
jgi:hypothetical protein